MTKNGGKSWKEEAYLIAHLFPPNSRHPKSYSRPFEPFNTLIHSRVGCQRTVINGGPARKKGPFRRLIETWGGIGIRCRKWSQAINKCTVDLPTQRIFMHARLGDRSTGQLKMPEMPGQDPFQNYAKYKCLHILSTLVRWWYAWSHQRWGTTIRLCTKCARWFHATYTMPH